MIRPVLTSRESGFLLGLAVFGLLVPNGVFLWYALFYREVVFAALANPVALVFAFEAFVLMFLFAWLLAKVGVTRPGWKVFVVLSLIGSMLFSVPLVIRRVLGGRAAHFDSAQ